MNVYCNVQLVVTSIFLLIVLAFYNFCVDISSWENGNIIGSFMSEGYLCGSTGKFSGIKKLRKYD